MQRSTSLLPTSLALMAALLLLPTTGRAQSGNHAVHLNGVDAYGTAAGVGSLYTNSTWEAWVRLPNYQPNLTGPRSVLFRWGMYSHGAPMLDASNGAVSAMEPCNTSGAAYQPTPGTVPEGIWTHLAIVYELTTIRIYVNGHLHGTIATGTCPYAGWQTVLGANGYIGYSAFLHATVDEARISNTPRYSTAFTPARAFTADQNTVGLWHFDEGSGNVAHDSSGHGRHFTLHGGYSWTSGNTPGTSGAATATAYGTGCGSPVMQLIPDPAGRPVRGNTARALITDAPTPAVGVAMGFSNTFSFPVQLPFELSGIGMPGCFLLQSTDVAGYGVNQVSGTTYAFDYFIPAATAVGTTAYVQAYAFAPGANAAQIVASNGVEWVVGDL